MIRPVNVLIGMISIAVGALTAGRFSPLRNIFLACLSGGIITAAANAVNDYFDIEIDRINKPQRPLPAGKLQPGAVRNFAILLFCIGPVLGGFISLTAFIIALSASVLLFFYSSHFKRTVLWGNFIVSCFSALAFIYGGVAVNRVEIAVIPAAFAFFFHFGREILKDIEDMEGDRLEKADTFPVRFGLRCSRRLITLIFFLLICLTFLPYIYQVFGKIYLLIVLFGVDLFLLFVIISLWRDASKANLHKLSEWLKLDMLVGLLSVLAGVYLS